MGKNEIFSKNFIAQPERNKAFLWPTSYVGKFFMAHPLSLALSRGIARKRNDNQPFLVHKKLHCQWNYIDFSLKQRVIDSVTVQYS